MSSSQAHNSDAANLTDLPLGKSVSYPDQYNPEILFRIPRENNSSKIYGFDRWFCYELSFLSNSGLPVNIGLELLIPSNSAYIVESKSLKLYLGSLASEKFNNVDSCLNRIKSDLQKLLQTEDIAITDLDLKATENWSVKKPQADCIDNPAIFCDQFEDPRSELIKTGSQFVQKTLYSDIFRSLCPVTQQPDYASVIIKYAGLEILPESLLKYLVAFRKHSGFHESCCEKIFADLMSRDYLKELTVACYFTRRGGIEINPLRSTKPVDPKEWRLRTVRQ